MSYGGWEEIKRQAGDDGKGLFPLPIVTRAFNFLIFFVRISTGNCEREKPPYNLRFTVM